MLRSPFILCLVVTVLLALLGSACAPRAVMQPRIASASRAPAGQPSAMEPSAMEQSCAGELCFPYEAGTE